MSVDSKYSIGESLYPVTVNSDVYLAFCNVNDFTTTIDVTEPQLAGDKSREYVRWGLDNTYPYALIQAIADDEVLSPNKLMNIQTCYGAGLLFKDLATNEKTKDKDIRRFMMRNAYPRFLLEQISDMKYFYFSVDVLILNKEGTKIVSVRHKSAANIRFAKQNTDGVIPYVVCGNFLTNDPKEDKIELLNEFDPLEDLRVRMGISRNYLGQYKKSTTRKFAVLTKFPTPADRYYPRPYYTSFIRSKWYQIKKLIPVAKLAKLKNNASLKYIVEIHERFWDNLLEREGIYEDVAKRERIEEEKRRIIDFVSGLENSGKMWFSTAYVGPDGKEYSEIKVTNLMTQKEGGDWAEDIGEASAIACYSDGVHPNMVGATPGKGGANNSGSDKRELFTMKQSLETSFHDLMLNLQEVIIEFNDWNVEPVIPMITLTTLDKHKDAELNTVNELNDTKNE